jgi:holo-ACP synthase
MSVPVHTPTGSQISLAHMLQRRDARVATQRALAARLSQPLVQLTLVNPGPVKDTVQACFVFEQGLVAMNQALVCAGQGVLAFEQGYFITGPEALWAVDGAVLEIKRCAMALEDQHRLGRLWDLDVIDVDGRSISRQQLDAPVRRCLVCDQAAHACARSARHAPHQLQDAIKDIVDAYRHSFAA